MTSACDLLVTGAKGQLGRAIVAEAGRRGLRALGVDVDEMPLDDRARILEGVGAAAPRAILHCGAITTVDGCEAEPLAAYRVNGLGTAWVADAAAACGAAMAYV
ncbi:MAG: sugar nucleotide-binding protein, partial [Planctomycetota bacterium]|nr:sugar nucleotide-binding protein [Planctomycetota bacterium]